MDLMVDKDNNSPHFGDMVFLNGDTPATDNFTESVAQRVFILLRTFETEWWLNTTTGIPYLQRILGKKANKTTVDRIIQQKVLAEEGVSSIERYTSTLGGDRVYSANMVIRTTQGTTFTATVDGE